MKFYLIVTLCEYVTLLLFAGLVKYRYTANAAIRDFIASLAWPLTLPVVLCGILLYANLPADERKSFISKFEKAEKGPKSG